MPDSQNGWHNVWVQTRTEAWMTKTLNTLISIKRLFSIRQIEICGGYGCRGARCTLEHINVEVDRVNRRKK